MISIELEAKLRDVRALFGMRIGTLCQSRLDVVLSTEFAGKNMQPAVFLCTMNNCSRMKHRQSADTDASRFQLRCVQFVTQNACATGACWRRPRAPQERGKQENGGRGEPDRAAASCSDLFFNGIQIRAQFMAGNTGGALDVEHSQRWNFIPLCDGLLGNAERGSQLGQAACRFDRAIEWSF